MCDVEQQEQFQFQMMGLEGLHAVGAVCMLWTVRGVFFEEDDAFSEIPFFHNHLVKMCANQYAFILIIMQD